MFLYEAQEIHKQKLFFLFLQFTNVAAATTVL